MNKYKILCRMFSYEHGYLSSSSALEIEAKNRTQALTKAKEMKRPEGFNRFQIVDSFELSPGLLQLERDYQAQELKLIDNPEIKGGN